MMLAVRDAQQLVIDHTPRLPAEMARAGLPALGSVLAEDIVSELDSPPFAKSMMDGFALRSSDVSRGTATLRIVGELLAGQIATKAVGPGEAICIMTGAPIPDGADAVVMHEKTALSNDSGSVTIPGPVAPGQNILSRGAEMKRGDLVFVTGTKLRPQELGVLATMGKTQIRVYRRPSVAVVSTGDEVVEPGEDLKAGQFRNSNAILLQAQTIRAGAPVQYLGIARDNIGSLRTFLDEGLHHDVLLISGGVSAGKVDLVPSVLADLGVEAIFHKVAMKPGKPLLFGRRGTTLVFGLPGNPVSSHVGFELFVRPALRTIQNRLPESLLPRVLRAELTHEFGHKSDRPTYYPARLEGNRVTLPTWHGSADLRTLSATNGLAVVPAGEMQYVPGTPFDVLMPELD